MTLDPAALLDKARTILTGESARAIGYGGALVVVGVVALANALGLTQLGQNISVSDAFVLATTAITTLVGIIEGIRHYVFSANTVAAIAVKAPEATTAAIDAGVPVEVILDAVASEVDTTD